MAHMAYWPNNHASPYLAISAPAAAHTSSDVTGGLRKAQAPNACTQLQHALGTSGPEPRCPSDAATVDV